MKHYIKTYPFLRQSLKPFLYDSTKDNNTSNEKSSKNSVLVEFLNNAKKNVIYKSTAVWII